MDSPTYHATSVADNRDPFCVPNHYQSTYTRHIVPRPPEQTRSLEAAAFLSLLCAEKALLIIEAARQFQKNHPSLRAVGSDEVRRGREKKDSIWAKGGGDFGDRKDILLTTNPIDMSLEVNYYSKARTLPPSKMLPEVASKAV